MLMGEAVVLITVVCTPTGISKLQNAKMFPAH